MENSLYGYFGGIARKRKVPILCINGTEDHLHLLVKLPATIEIGVLMKELKSYTTGWMKKQGFVDFGWQDGYRAFSISLTHLNRLRKYIEEQKEHHKKKTFKEEVRSLNKIWGCNWMSDLSESP